MTFTRLQQQLLLRLEEPFQNLCAVNRRADPALALGRKHHGERRRLAGGRGRLVQRGVPLLAIGDAPVGSGTTLAAGTRRPEAR